MWACRFLRAGELEGEGASRAGKASTPTRSIYTPPYATVLSSIIRTLFAFLPSFTYARTSASLPSHRGVALLIASRAITRVYNSFLSLFLGLPGRIDALLFLPSLPLSRSSRAFHEGKAYKGGDVRSAALIVPTSSSCPHALS